MQNISIILSRHIVTFTLISLKMKGQAWRKYFCLLGTPLNYHKTLDVYLFFGLSCTLSKARLYSHTNKWKKVKTHVYCVYYVLWYIM